MKAWSLLLVLLITGCAVSMKELRSFNPEYVTASPKNPKDIANCIAYECQNEDQLYGMHTSMIENNGIYYITISNVGPLGVDPWNDITVKPNNENGSSIELRTIHTMVKIFPNILIKIIKKCASPTKTSQGQAGVSANQRSVH